MRALVRAHTLRRRPPLITLSISASEKLGRAVARPVSHSLMESDGIACEPRNKGC